MIKLQMLLHSLTRAALDEPALRSQLSQLGIRATGVGLATVSAEISADAFEKVWGKPPAVVSGFAPDLEACALPVPAALAASIESISTVPRHSAFEKKEQ